MSNVDSIITDPSNNLSADYAHKIDQRIKNLRYSIDNSFLDLAKSLKEVRDGKIYKLLNMNSFEEYIAQPELAFERRSVYSFIQIYETFVEKHNVHPDALLEAGWTKLAKVIPYTNDENFGDMLEKATSLSRSDLDKDLVDQGFIAHKEPEVLYHQCPYCQRVSVVDKRADIKFSQEDYKKVIDTYLKVKGITLKGNEYAPVQSAIKTMFMNGRTPDEIVAAIEILGEQDEFSWTINTVTKKIAELLLDTEFKPKRELSEADRKLLANSQRL